VKEGEFIVFLLPRIHHFPTTPLRGALMVRSMTSNKRYSSYNRESSMESVVVAVSFAELVTVAPA